MNRIKGFFPQEGNDGANVQRPNTPKVLNTLTLTPLQVALLHNCLMCGAVAAGLVTPSGKLAARMIGEAGTVLHEFEREVWESVRDMLAACDMSGDDVLDRPSKFNDYIGDDAPPFPFGEEGQEPKEGWQQ